MGGEARVLWSPDASVPLLLPQDRNEITDIAPLNYGGLARLETLSLSGNRLTELPEQARPAVAAAA